jgi:hypothetical protein
MQLLVLGDGVSDRDSIPRLVESILGFDFRIEFRAWKQLRLNRGYNRKLQYALFQARDMGVEGVVATLDCDRERPRERLNQLRSAREDDRKKLSSIPIPTALGEARPHLEAWLLDDPKAVRDVLHFPNEKSIPNVARVNPKTELNALIGDCDRTDRPLTLLAEIAGCIDISRCNHSADTGLAEFVQDVRDELGPLVSASA